MARKMETVMDKIERWKLLAELFIQQDTKGFIRKINGDLHFCIIISSNDNFILVDNFGPEQRAGKRDKIYWYSISEFGEFKEKGDNGR